MSFNPDEASNVVKEVIFTVQPKTYIYNNIKHPLRPVVYLIEWTALLLVSCLTHACRINASLFIWVQVCSINSVSVFIGQCIEGIIGGVDYSQNKVNQWTASIVEHSLTQLVKQGKPFKYIGTSFSIW